MTFGFSIAWGKVSLALSAARGKKGNANIWTSSSQSLFNNWECLSVSRKEKEKDENLKSQKSSYEMFNEVIDRTDMQ